MVRLGILSRLCLGIALVDKGHFDRVPGHLLDLGRQGTDLASILLVGRRHVRRQQMPQPIHRRGSKGSKPGGKWLAQHWPHTGPVLCHLTFFIPGDCLGMRALDNTIFRSIWSALSPDA